MKLTIADLLKDKIKGRPIWDYKIWSPLSFDDTAEIKVVVYFGEVKKEKSESYILQVINL